MRMKAEKLGVTIGDIVKKPKAKKVREPKYRNPEKPEETWHGMGHAPKWLKAKVEAGANKDDFKIAA